MAVLRHMGEAEFAQRRAGSTLSIGLAVEQDLARSRLADAGDRFQQFRLAVAGDAGDADDLAGADVEGDVVDHGDAATVLDGQIARPTARLRPGLAAPFSTRSSTRRPTISSASSLDRGLRGLAGRDHLAAAHHRDRVGDRHDLAQLVGDQDDRLALVAQHAQGCGRDGRPRPASARRSARRGSGSRRRDTGPSGSRRAAAARPGSSSIERVRIDVEAVVRSRAASARRAPAATPLASSAPPSAPSMTFSSTVKLSTSMKCWCTMPMPSAIAAWLSRMVIGLPLTRISPLSA